MKTRGALGATGPATVVSRRAWLDAARAAEEMAANVQAQRPSNAAAPEPAAARPASSAPAPARETKPKTPGRPSAEAWTAAMSGSWAKRQPDGAASVSLDRLRSLAASGDAAAACDLGILHLHGERGAPKSSEHAAEWFHKSATGGDARGATNYAVLLARGTGVAKDPVECMRWYRAAAESATDGKIADQHVCRILA